MDNRTHVDNNETALSPHTNRPITATIVSSHPIFWCEICSMKLTTPTIAFQHLHGRSHKAKINAKQNSFTQNCCGEVSRLNHAFDALSINNKSVGAVTLNSSTKKNNGQQRNASVPVVIDLTNKKNKEQSAKPVASDPNLTCDDCNLVFDTAIIAIQHFKGKKHTAKIAAKLIAKQRGSQRGVRGSRDCGRGDYFDRGRGVMTPFNNFPGRIENDFNPARYDFFFNTPNQIRNNYALQRNDYYSNPAHNYRTSQHEDYEEHFSSVNGDSTRGRVLSPPNEYYLDYDNLSSVSTKATKKNKSNRGVQRGGKWQPGKGRGYPSGQSNQAYQGGYQGSGVTRGGKFGNGIGRANPLNSTWWCKYFVRGAAMKGNT